MLVGIGGIQWGDEGKGCTVDRLAADFDIVVRYQGGNNAGHTVENEKGKFILNLLPSGITCEGVVNVMGDGMVIDIEHLSGEMKKLQDRGIAITPENLKISDKAIICMPYHVQLDCLEEERLGGEKYGSTRKGIAPVYSDRYAKKGIRIGDLLDYNTLEKKLKKIVDWKTLTVEKVYGAEPISLDETLKWLKAYGDIIKPYITDTTKYLNNAIEQNKDILFEAQLGVLRDITFGIWPFTTSSHTIAAYATIGAGIPGKKLDKVIGVMKAYSTCVGAGPFAVEIFGDEENNLREAGNEYGATTGRPRRVGPFDIPASKYGIMMQGADEIALTKLDVLSYMDEIPVCVAYEIDGKRTTDFLTGDALDRAEPIYEYLPGFKQDISHIRKFEDLPQEAKDYIKFIADATGANIKYISVGPEREAYIEVEGRTRSLSNALTEIRNSESVESVIDYRQKAEKLLRMATALKTDDLSYLSSGRAITCIENGVLNCYEFSFSHETDSSVTFKVPEINALSALGGKHEILMEIENITWTIPSYGYGIKPFSDSFKDSPEGKIFDEIYNEVERDYKIKFPNREIKLNV